MKGIDLTSGRAMYRRFILMLTSIGNVPDFEPNRHEEGRQCNYRLTI